MAQPVSEYSPYRLLGTAAGTVVVKSGSGVLASIFQGTATTGTVTFYDALGTAGTASTNYLTAVAGTVPQTEIHANLKNGLVAIIGGTVDVLIMTG